MSWISEKEFNDLVPQETRDKLAGLWSKSIALKDEQGDYEIKTAILDEYKYKMEIRPSMARRFYVIHVEECWGQIGEVYSCDGGLNIIKYNGKCYWGIENYNGIRGQQEIPQYLYDALSRFEKEHKREHRFINL